VVVPALMDSVTTCRTGKTKGMEFENAISLRQPVEATEAVVRELYHDVAAVRLSGVRSVCIAACHEPSYRHRPRH
jgi:hypothetical protein